MAQAEIAQSQPDDARERLRQYFFEDRSPARWNELWTAGTFLPWDRGTPNPALIEALDTKTDIIGAPTVNLGGDAEIADGKRKRVLVPGCGKGYDVYLFAAYGYDAFGLDVGGALKAAKAFENEVSGREEFKVRNPAIGKGKVTFVEGDFYKEEWETTAGAGKFDVIYDYTFLCAMAPTHRPAWSKRMTELLAPGGTLICVEFPTYKDPATGGPPWGLTPETYEQLLYHPGEEPEYDGKGYVVRDDREPESKSLSRVDHWKPSRTHKVGEGTDWVSLWQHRP